MPLNKIGIKEELHIKIENNLVNEEIKCVNYIK